MRLARNSIVGALLLLIATLAAGATPSAPIGLIVTSAVALPAQTAVVSASVTATVTPGAAPVRPSANGETQQQASDLIDRVFKWLVGSLLTLLGGLFTNKQLSEVVLHFAKLVVLDIEERWEREGYAQKGAAKLLAALGDLRQTSWLARLLPESYLLRHLQAAVAALPGVGATGKRD